MGTLAQTKQRLLLSFCKDQRNYAAVAIANWSNIKTLRNTVAGEVMSSIRWFEDRGWESLPGE